MRVVVGKSELVGNGVEYMVAPLWFQRCHQTLENIHTSVVLSALALEFGDALAAHVQDQGIDQGDIVSCSRSLVVSRITEDQAVMDLDQQCGRRPLIQVRVQRLHQLRTAQLRSDVRENLWRLGNVWQQVHL